MSYAAGIIAQPFSHPHWPAIKGMLGRAAAKTDDTTLEQVVASFEAGQSQLWAVLDGNGRPLVVAVTQLLTVKGGKQAFVWLLSGDFMQGGARLIEVFEEWARAEGCATAEINGRLGWMRKLRDYKPVAVTLRKEL